MHENFLVTKSNDFIMKSAYDLSLEEQRLILVLASMVQPEDKEFKEYTLKIKDFMELIGVRDKNKYSKLPEITKNLMQKVFEMEKIDLKNNKKILVQLAWISGVIHSQNLEEVNQGTGEITLMFNPLLKDYLLELNGFYTQYKLCNVLSMKSKYSPRIYELLKSNEYQKKGFVIEIKELRRMFKAEEIYPLYADFKKYVILQAQKELEQFSDIRFEFEEIKKVRKVDSIKFFIFPNVPKDTKNKIKIPKLKTKTKKELNTDKIITEQEKDKIKAEKVKADFDLAYEAFLKLPQEEQSQIELEAYNDFLKESESSDNKTLRGIFEKSKKPLIIKKFKEKKLKSRKKS